LDELIRESVNRSDEMAKRSGSGVVTAEVALEVTARMMAGSPYLDSVLIFGMARSTVYEVFHRTLDALSNLLSLSGIPTSERELESLDIGFKNSRSPRNPLNGCIGAIDWLAVKIKKPHDELHPSQFYCRKQF